MKDPVMTKAEAKELSILAIGRLFRIASRPYQPGDDEEFFRLRAIVLDAAEVLGIGSGRW